jgi:2-polyprenyl-3-methyl-5-hydroxy-6-metoxy-1,4-benzoquinol methylase
MNYKKELEWTGERYVPQLRGGIALEHLHRYAFASSLVRGLNVLDIASGEGYGSEILSRFASSVIGVDIDQASIEHASEVYVRDNLSYRKGSCTEIPVTNNSVDVIVSFETIEHIKNHDSMMAEIKRVLKPGGLLIISSPERKIYNETTGATNPFHLKELSFPEFSELLKKNFKNVRLMGQRIVTGSAILTLEESAGPGLSYRYSELPGSINPIRGLHEPEYILAVCSDEKLKEPGYSFCYQEPHETDYAVHLTREYEDMQKRIKNEVRSLKNSFSWRLTAPFRVLHNMLFH